MNTTGLRILAVSNEPIGRVVVDIGTMCVAVYLCDGTGAVLDEEWFKMPHEIPLEDARYETNELYGMIYDYMNDLLNTDSEENEVDTIRTSGGLFMPTENEITQYGASLSWLEQIRLLSEWSPLLAFSQRFMLEPDEYVRAIIVADACEWVAHKTNTGLDDQVVTLIASIMKTKQGEALVRFLLAQIPDGEAK